MRRFAIIFLVVAVAILSLYSYRTYMQRPENAKPSLQRNVYIITASGLRANHLSSYMYAPIQTPAIDFLAYDGIRFTNAFTSSTDSLAAHLSLLSGSYPFHDPVKQTYEYLLDQTKDGIPENLTLLPELLSKRGYRTAAFLADPELRYPAFFGTYFHQVFTGDRQLYPWESGYSTAMVCKIAREWIRENISRPHFVLLNFDEPTPPFLPPAPYNRQYAHYPYDGEIAGLDEQIGLFVNLLKETGLFQRSIVVLTAPYGQSLDEESRYFNVRNDVLHVPLTIAAPGLLPRHENYDTQVSIVDVVPTILKLLESDTDTKYDGLPLFEANKNEQVEHPYVLGTVPFPTQFGFQPEFFVRGKEYLYISGQNEDVIRHSAYKITDSEKEQWIQNGRNQLRIAGWKASNLPVSNLETDPAALLEKVRDLAREDRTDVAFDLLRSFTENHTARNSYLNSLLGNLAEASGDVEGGIQYFKKAAGISAGRRSLSDLARAELASNQPSEALDVLKRYKRNFPTMSYDLRSTYALALSLAGRTNEALLEFETVLKQNPRFAEAYVNRGRLWKKLGRSANAEADWKKAIDVDPANAAAYFELAALSEETGHSADGIPYLRQILRLQPQNYDVMLNLAILHQRAGHEREARNLCRQVLLNTNDPRLKEKAKRIFGN
jgi:arylsulfatase A-like enzyme/Flp pilus assembly protein TadD